MIIKTGNFGWVWTATYEKSIGRKFLVAIKAAKCKVVFNFLTNYKFLINMFHLLLHCFLYFKLSIKISGHQKGSGGPNTIIKIFAKKTWV